MKKYILYFLFAALCLSAGLNSQAKNVLDADWDDVVDGFCDDQDSAWWSSAEAIRIARNVLLYQRDIGGWPKNTEMQLVLSQAEKNELIADKAGEYCTIDNDAVKLELLFLSKVYTAISDEEFRATIKDGFLNGIQYLLDAQYENGGWPQYYPYRSATSYSNHITYNDNAMTNVMEILRHIYEKDGEYAIEADENTIAAAKTAFEKGLECILKTQYVQDGILTSWCAQHDFKTLEPVMARSYELASLSGGECAGILKLLMSVEEPSYDIRRAIYYAANWYDQTRVVGYKLEDFINDDGLEDIRVVADAGAPDMWARFYTLEDNIPFFCSRDGIMKFSLAEISHERRNNYSWYVNSGHKVFDAYDSWYPQWGDHREQETVIVYPLSGSGYYTSDSIRVKANANEYAIGSIEKFELFIDDEFVADFIHPKIDTLLTGFTEGAHSIIVKSTDDKGHIAMDTSTISIENPFSGVEIDTDGNGPLCYPNPAYSSFSVDLSEIGDASIDIYNLSGQLVYQTRAYKGIHRIRDHGLASGLYLVRVNVEGKGFKNQRIVIR